MFFLVDTNKKIIFGWSAKCGCSHIKTIYWFLQTNNIEKNMHLHSKGRNKLPTDIENYTTLIFCRNPYKRIISGFLEKYKINGEFRHRWKYPTITFSQFVNELIKNNWKVIDKHHFSPQTEGDFDKKILQSKSIKLYDISNIDYGYIEQLYDKKIPECVIDRKYGHERMCKIKDALHYDKFVYDLYMMQYIDFNVDTKYFYNKEIRYKVFNFYKKDFIFFNQNGIDYINEPL